jgi:hypothetical protein
VSSCAGSMGLFPSGAADGIGVGSLRRRTGTGPYPAVLASHCAKYGPPGRGVAKKIGQVADSDRPSLTFD